MTLHASDSKHILHPVIRGRWMARADRRRRDGPGFASISRSFMKPGPRRTSTAIVVVRAPRRLSGGGFASTRSWTPHIADRIIAAQLDLDVKDQKADHVIWNDSTTACLDGQAALLAGWLTQHYGLKLPTPLGRSARRPTDGPDSTRDAEEALDRRTQRGTAQRTARARNALQLRPQSPTRRGIISSSICSAPTRRAAPRFLPTASSRSRPQGGGFLRWPRYNFRSLPQDVFVPVQIERQFSSATATASPPASVRRAIARNS